MGLLWTAVSYAASENGSFGRAGFGFGIADQMCDLVECRCDMKGKWIRVAESDLHCDTLT